MESAAFLIRLGQFLGKEADATADGTNPADVALDILLYEGERVPPKELQETAVSLLSLHVVQRAVQGVRKMGSKLRRKCWEITPTLRIHADAPTPQKATRANLGQVAPVFYHVSGTSTVIEDAIVLCREEVKEKPLESSTSAAQRPCTRAG
eukprot:2779886-Prymnesium_polylepis.1